MKHSMWCWSGVIPCLLLAGLAWAAPDQPELDPELLAAVNKIKAIDNHCHAKTNAITKADEEDPLGRSYPSFPARLRESNPEWIAAWRTLYGYKHNDASLEHVRELLKIKKELVEKNGKNHPAWVLDQAGIEIALVQEPKMGADMAAPRFRWVPRADGLYLPFDSKEDFVKGSRKENGIEKPPATLGEFIETVVKERLQQWKKEGALAIKFGAAYYRSLDFANVSEPVAKALYEKYVAGGEPQPKDYKALQDYLFREVVREAGRSGLVVHIHTGEGGGPYFSTSGSNPLLLESVLTDCKETNFVLLHGGGPFERVTSVLIKKPNVYTDYSAQTFVGSRHTISENLRMWLEMFPEKVLYGTDAFALRKAPLRGWEETTCMTNKTAREALALALTRMVRAGDITRPRAEEIARMVLRETAVKLYDLEKKR